MIRRLPGTYVDPAGMGSRITKLVAGSAPVFVYETVYCSTSPRRSGPPGCVMLVTDFELVMLGAYRSVANEITWSK